MDEDAVTAADLEGLFSKRSSSNILSDPRILEHLRIVAEEAQSLEENDDCDAETEMAANRKELTDKIAGYNKRNQLGAFRLSMKEDLNFEGALRFYFEDGNEKLTKAVRLNNRTPVSELLPTLIEKFKPDLDQTSLVRKAKLYEVHDEFTDKEREADEICLDPSDNPLDIALNARLPPRFVLRLEYDKPRENLSPTTHPNGVAKQLESLNSSVQSVRSSDGSTTSGSTTVGSPLSRFSPTRGHSGTPSSPRKSQSKFVERPSSAGSEKTRNIFKGIQSPRAAIGMFFDGVTSPTQDRSSHQSKAARQGKRQRKRSFGSLLKLKKSGSSKKNVELSTNHLAPGVLKVFGGHVSPGANYKSVRATDLTTAEEIVKEALDRYKLDHFDAKDYVLCDVVGYFTDKEQAEESLDPDSESWITEYSRVIGDKEKPLVLQQLWKPITGFSRRFELRKRIETQKSSFFQVRGSVAVMKAASMREVKIPPFVKEARNHKSSVTHSAHHESFGTDEGTSSTRNSVVMSPYLPPTDTPYLLLIRGFAIADDFLYHRLDETIALIGRHVNAPGSVSFGDEHADHNPDINLFSPDILPHHCVLSKKVETEGDLDLEEECDVNFVVCLEPNKNAIVKVNGVPITSSIKMCPGDLISIGDHYVFMFKDPTQVLDSALQLHWMTALQRFHEMSRNFNRTVPEAKPISVDSDESFVEPDGRELRIAYLAEDEDRLLDMVMNTSETCGECYELTPSYLIVMCIEHSVKYHSETQTRQLMMKISNSIQSVAWEKTSELSNTIEKETPPDKAMADLLPKLNPVIFWMANCLEMHHYLQNNISRYLGDKQPLDDSIADEELVVCLEEVVMYTFQQTVYHLTKVLYLALPVILDTNPFQCDDDDADVGKRPHEIEIVINIFHQTHTVLTKYNVHNDIIHQLFAYLFFFTNASLFNTLMERGAGGKFYRWAKGAQIRGNLDALEGWATQVQLQDEYVHYLTRLSTAADLLATPKVQLLQADWNAIRRDFPSLNAAQVQQILGEYQLGAGKTRPRGWFPPPEEVEPALRTADILLSFSEHPPLSLPSSGFVFSMAHGPDSERFYQYLAMVRQSCGPVSGLPKARDIKPPQSDSLDKPVEPLVLNTSSIALESSTNLDDFDDVPSVTVSPPPSDTADQPNTITSQDRNKGPEKPPRVITSSPETKVSAVSMNRPETPPTSRPVPTPRQQRDRVSTQTPPHPRSPQPTPRVHKIQQGSEKSSSPRQTDESTSNGSTQDSLHTTFESPRGSQHGRTSSTASSASSMSSFGTTARVDNPVKTPSVRKESGSYHNDRNKWIDVKGSAVKKPSLDGLSVVPVIEENGHVTDRISKVKDQNSNDTSIKNYHKESLSNTSNDSDDGKSQRILEGMRDGQDGQDDVFIVELEKKGTGLGLGLIDGLDGRLRLGDRILAVNGTSLVGADYQSAMQEIRQAGKNLSFLVAKSDIHVAMKITASSC